MLVLAAAVALAGKATAQEAPARRELVLVGMAGQGFHSEVTQGFGEFGSAAIQVARPVSRRLALMLEWHPLFLVRQPRLPPTGPRETVEAFALDLGIRWFPAPASWRARPYVEFLEGPFYGLRRIPARGSTFNFLTQFGTGVLLPSGETWHPLVSYRWVHISNAGLGMHNPDWDFHTILLGAGRSFP